MSLYDYRLGKTLSHMSIEQVQSRRRAEATDRRSRIGKRLATTRERPTHRVVGSPPHHRAHDQVKSALTAFCSPR